jgi:hypothetical protein
MTKAFDLRTELARVHDAATAWSFIRGFTSHWSRPLSHGDGYDDAELQSAEQRLGITLLPDLHAAMPGSWPKPCTKPQADRGG